MDEIAKHMKALQIRKMEIECKVKENFYKEWTPSLQDINPLEHPEWFLSQELAVELDLIHKAEKELLEHINPAQEKKQTKITSFFDNNTGSTIIKRPIPTKPPLSEISFVDDNESYLTETSVSSLCTTHTEKSEISKRSLAMIKDAKRSLKKKYEIEDGRPL